ncbi:MAG: Ger(x)C family spore germination protein [Bacillota bacterium]
MWHNFKFNLTKKAILLCLPLLLFTGCFDSQNPEDLSYVLTMGMDLSDDDTGSFTFAPAKTQTKDPTLLQAEGNTVAGALVKVDSEHSKSTDLGQLKMVVVGESLLKNGEQFLVFLEELERNQEISEKVLLLATEGKASDILAQLIQEDQGLFLWDFHQNQSQQVAIAKALDLDAFLAELTEQNGAVVIPKITLKDETITLGGGMVLVNYDYLFSLDQEEEEGYLLLLGEAEGAVIEAEYQGHTVALEVVKNRVDYDFDVVDEKVVCTVLLQIQGDLIGAYESNAFDVRKRAELTTLLENSIKDEMQHTINIANEHEALEAFGLGAKARRYLFGEIGLESGIDDVEIVVDVHIFDVGKIR